MDDRIIFVTIKMNKLNIKLRNIVYDTTKTFKEIKEQKKKTVFRRKWIKDFQMYVNISLATNSIINHDILTKLKDYYYDKLIT